MLSEAVIGERRGGVNVQSDLRAGPYSELIVNDAGLGRYFEINRLKRLFCLPMTGVGTAPAAANLSPLAAGTGQPYVGIFNPQDSGVAAVILQAWFAQIAVVTTATSCYPLWNYIPSPTGITAPGGASAVRLDLPSGASSSAMKTFVNSALTGSAAASLLRPMGQGSYSGSAVANGAMATWFEEVAGSIIVPPGAFLGIAGSATSAALVQAAMTWVEIDWPL